MQLVLHSNVMNSTVYQLNQYLILNSVYICVPSRTWRNAAPSRSRYSEIAPKVKDICERYELPYNSGRFSKQWYTVHRSIFRLAFPGGKPRPKPGPYHSDQRRTGPEGGSEAGRFRERVPAEHPAAGPEHDSSGVEVQPPPRGRD